MASAMFTGISVNMPQCFWTPRCPMHPLWWSSHPGSTEWQPAMWAKTRWWWKQPAGWVTAHAFKDISEPHTFVLTWVPSLALGSLNLFFSASNCLLLLFMCVCVCVCARMCTHALQQPPFSFRGPCICVCVSVALLTRLAHQEIRIILLASAQPRHPPVTALRSAPRWLVLSITIYLLLE